jgi:hypothetical protein
MGTLERGSKLERCAGARSSCLIDGFDPSSVSELCRRDGKVFGLVDRPFEIADALAQRAADITELARPEMIRMTNNRSIK